VKVLIDTNIIISAALNSSGTPYKAFVKAVTFPYRGIMCEQNVTELYRIFKRKFPSKIISLKSFLSIALTTIELVPVPETMHPLENKIRDINDRPILRAALHVGADIILTGDKDFLESGIDNPMILSASEFLVYY
jgi:putative PIN family toxin of toxin-antitoxin system